MSPQTSDPGSALSHHLLGIFKEGQKDVVEIHETMIISILYKINLQF